MPSEILIEDFWHPTHQWKAKNDPVMGGESTATVELVNGLAVFDGQVVNVPFLQAPGFITMETRGGVYPDVSSCQGFKISMRTAQVYHGYRLSFGNVHVPGGHFAYGYKANFEAPVDEFGDVYIPFTDFTAKWDDATGDAIVTCAQDPQYCPTRASLQNLQNIIFWGEGVAGKVHLEISSIKAAHCAVQQQQPQEAEEIAAATVVAPTTTTTSWMDHGIQANWIASPIALIVLFATVALLVVPRMARAVKRRSCYTAVDEERQEIGLV